MKKTTILSVMAVLCQKKLKAKRLKLKALAFLALLYFIMGQLQAQERLKGRVVDAQTQEPMAGATIKVLNPAKTFITDNEGYFELNLPKGEYQLQVQYLNYATKQSSIALPLIAPLIIQLVNINEQLNEVQVIGYGTVTKRLNTGNVSSLLATDIEKQPVANPLAALQGRVAGLNITQSNGLAGGGFKVQLRGQSSLLQGTSPLYIIDGIPFAADNEGLNLLNSAAGSASTGTGMSPFNLINPADIERIDVLKDADATAIYGSRGANGVILITTKKANNNALSIQLNAYSGIGKVTRTMDMLNTEEYVMMRKEGFKNDNLVPTANDAPDLLLWDNSRYTDFKKLLIGGTAKTSDLQLSIAQGNATTQFAIGAGYHKETTVFPTDLGDTKVNMRISLKYNDKADKVRLNLQTLYANDVNQLTVTDLSSYINTNPMLKLYNSDGSLNWEEGGVTYRSLGMINANPLVFLHERYKGIFNNLNSNFTVEAKLFAGLWAKASLGYNITTNRESAFFPSTSIDPNSNSLARSSFGTRSQQGLIAEPQLNYALTSNKNKFNFLVGATWQHKEQNSQTINAYDYANDLLLGDVSAAGRSILNNSDRAYRYIGLYGRINYTLNEQLIVNLSARKDGSSRFAPQNRFNNFGALGMAWLFDQLEFVKSKLSFLSYGKLRGSFGITGNDQIGDYRYLNTWSAVSGTYNGGTLLAPNGLYNPNFNWERNKKLEFAIELGFFANKLRPSLIWYRNLSDNQLVNYTLPSQTGFSSILANLPAKIVNKGWEFELNASVVAKTSFNWSTALNISVPTNKLLAFPGLANSSYATTYYIGKPTNTRFVYNYMGVDPNTGTYLIKDLNQDGKYNTADREIYINTGARFFGGLSNSITFKGFSLDLFMEFKKQIGYNYLNNISNIVPSYGYFNQPKIVLERWQQQGQQTNIQKFTSEAGQVFTMAYSHLKASQAIYSDASFARLKNLSFSYNLKPQWLSQLGLTSFRIYAQGQNLFTITKYKGADPENQDLLVLPPLKFYTMGVQLKF